MDRRRCTHPLAVPAGLVRTAGDFAAVALRHGADRRVIALDYAGRGGSGRSPAIDRYGPEACLRDIQDVCAALHVPHAITIGTSFGGLLSLGLAAARPGLIRGVVLNDIGPEVATAGTGFIRDFVATDPALGDIAECVAFLKARLPPLSLQTDEEWSAMAALTYEQGSDGRFHPLWDTRIAGLLGKPPPDLWPLLGAVAGLPAVLVWGNASTVLLADTVARMRLAKPDMGLVVVPGIGHAPTLSEPMVSAALDQFLDGFA